MIDRQIFLHRYGGDMDGLHGATTWMTSSKRQLPQTPEDLRKELTKQTSIQRLIMEMEVLLSKLPYLLMRGLRVDWCPSCEGELLLSDQ